MFLAFPAVSDCGKVLGHGNKFGVILDGDVIFASAQEEQIFTIAVSIAIPVPS